MTITKIISKTTKVGIKYEIRIELEANSRDEADNAPYSDFKAYLYIDGKFIADIFPVLFEMEGVQKEIDKTSWSELYMDQLEEPADNTPF